jgi:serine/threonine protein kinase
MTDPPATSSDAEGAVVAGKYRVLALLGRGGMGSVFEVERLSDGSIFALKRIDRAAARDDVVMQRFAREVRAANAARSDHIVRVLEVGTDDGRPFLLMDRLHGEDLGARLRRQVRLAPREAVEVARQVLRGLERAHAVGVVHRDLKPDNVFLAETPAAPLCVKIVDFGMSKILAFGATTPLALTMKGVAIGTPLYMSPEQASARPDVDARSDIYSVGAILFECLTGRPPHVGETDEAVMNAIQTTPAPSIRAIDRTVSTGLAEVVDRALAFDRSQRFESAGAMRRALASPGSRDSTGESEAVAGQRGASSMRTVWIAALVALLAGATTTVVAATVLGRGGRAVFPGSSLAPSAAARR